MKIPVESEKYGHHIIFLDDEDYPLVEEYVWFIVKKNDKDHTLYAMTHNEYEKNIPMHRLLFDFPHKSIEVDHINHNGLDNRRENLRLCTRSQNAANCRPRTDGVSKYKGVGFKTDQFRRKPWTASIKVNYRTIRLGHFYIEEEAALAYNEAAIRYFGEFACINEVSLPENIEEIKQSRTRKTSSQYKGVNYRVKSKRWYAVIYVNKKPIHLGCFTSEIEAALSYNTAARSYFGENVLLNEVKYVS